ncbi:TetR/AcrR family transcriptional regulator [Loigolactobacillus coryniformis]|uniref:TetR family transcriptional regulator n=1 Tax=Loigolactobacillus coryniformis subsp. torquens DSM 20004 = KCTC 3535 TaxID=1423822 RepID=A0A2D1KLD6_9LACO|nr:TetR/AcrR family transcriptional regulator [Loigolactobacillus coryniformis]ATO42950.1 TetR family transcriptional regulator [Loigolactobacillus coryniformis subsp. torquens DSM 20004 = KCTC 3535]
MVRKKQIIRERILTGAYQLVVAQGFTHFTARNVAHAIHCSTQPLYQEFGSMANLKQAILLKLQHYLVNEVYNRQVTGNRILDMALDYIKFAQDNPELYHAIFVEDHFGTNAMHDFTYCYGQRLLAHYKPAKQLSAAASENVITGMWIIAQGIASLVSSSFITISEKQAINLLRAALYDFIHNNRLEDGQITVNSLQQLDQLTKI